MPRAARQPDGVPRRRGWGKGSIRWKNGAWEVTVRPHHGAPQDPWTRLKGKALAEAEAQLDLMVAQVEAGSYAPRPRRSPALTVAELWTRYDRHLAARLAAGTLEQARVDDIRGIVRGHVLPAFGEDSVTRVDSDLLYAYMAGKREGALPVAGRAQPALAPRTIHHHIGVIGQLFRWAAHHERKLAAYDPTHGLDLPTIDEEETEPYELDHARTIIGLLPSGTIRRIGQFTLGTGCRLAETLGAQQNGWHAGEHTLEIRHALKRSGGTMVLAPRGKNRAARRKLTASDALSELVEAQLAHNATLPPASEHLFRTDAGTAWNPSNFRNRHWYPAVYTGYAKVMPADERDRWLACVPSSLRTAAALLALDDISMRAVLDARRGDVDGDTLTYRDADGQCRNAQLSPDLAASLAAASSGASITTRLFPGRRGQPVALPAFIKAVFKEPFDQLGLRFDRRIHRARHTFVSLVSLEPSITDKEIQRRIGHGHASSTDRYRHLFHAQDQKPADVLARLTDGHTGAGGDRLHEAAELLGVPPSELQALLRSR